MLVFLSAFVLVGCAFSPGLYMGSATSQSGAAVPDAALSKVLQPHADALKTAGSDAPPSGVLTPITAELVRQLHQQSQADESARIRHLFGTPRPYAIGPGDLLHIVVPCANIKALRAQRQVFKRILELAHAEAG